MSTSTVQPASSRAGKRKQKVGQSALTEQKSAARALEYMGLAAGTREAILGAWDTELAKYKVNLRYGAGVTAVTVLFAVLLSGVVVAKAAQPGWAAKNPQVRARVMMRFLELARTHAEEVATLTRWVEMGLPWPAEAVKARRPNAGFDLSARKAAHYTAGCF